MRKISAFVVALAAAAILIGPAPAAAQTTVYNYDDGEAWWNAYECAEMKVLLPRYSDGNGPGAGTTNETAAAHEARVCVKYAMLPSRDKVVIETFIDRTMSSAHATHKAWWDAQSTTDTGADKQILAGQVSLVDTTLTEGVPYTGADDGYNGDARDTGVSTGFAAVFNNDYDDLPSAAKPIVDKAGDALSGRDPMMTTDTEAPALPLFATIGLGVLLAGRGWWNRRRAA